MTLCGAISGRLNCGCCDEVKFVCDLEPHGPEVAHRDQVHASREYDHEGIIEVRWITPRGAQGRPR